MSHGRALVTGGAGFLGSHLCRRLLADGFRVMALDDFTTGSVENVKDLLPHPRFALVEHNVEEPFAYEVDLIFNLACAASPVHYQRDPVRTTLTCVNGTHHALLLAERSGARFLQASTSEVYGDPEIHPQPESYHGYVSPIGPRACYDEGKRCAESLVMDFRRSRGVDARIARIFNTYGPTMAIDDGRVVSNFIVQALRDWPLTIYGDGKQTRSLCYVSDLIDGLVRLMNAERIDQPVNLGNPRELTVLQIAHEVIREVGRGRIEHRPLPEDDPKRRSPDISVARALLDFDPKISFEEGLEATVSDFERRLRASSPVRASA